MSIEGEVETGKKVRMNGLKGLIPEDLLRFKWLSELELSPNGQHLAYTVKRVSTGSNDYTVDLYLVDLETPRKLRKLTQDEGQASSLAWSKDSSRLAYVWKGPKATELNIYQCLNNDKITYKIDGSAPSELDWSPDGARIAYVKRIRILTSEQKYFRDTVGPQSTVRHITMLPYKMNGVGFIEDQYQHIHIIALGTGEEIQLSDGECDFFSPKWSWRGDKLAFVGKARDQNVELGQGKIFIYNYPGGSPEELMPNWIGEQSAPVWGPEDEEIVFVGRKQSTSRGNKVFGRTSRYVDNQVFAKLWIYKFKNGVAKNLIPTIDQRLGNCAVGDQRAAFSLVKAEWPQGSEVLYFLITEQGAVHLYAVSLKEGPKPLIEGDCVVFNFSPVKGRIAYGKATPQMLGNVFVLNESEKKKHIARLTDLNPWLRSTAIQKPEEIWYEGLDGRKIHGWIIKPVGYKEGKKYPTIVYVHCSMFSWDFSHEFQCLAQAGYVVAYFNQIGTTAGYGQAWTQARQGDMGGKEYEEIMLGVDWLVKQPYADEEHMGVTGGSCGGQLTNWIIGHTDRFAAAVTQRSTANYVNIDTSDLGPAEAISDVGTDPFESLQRVWELSPIAYAKNIHTPLLILHGDEDFRCPIEQAEQLFTVLRSLDREVEFAWFLGENHNLSRSGTPANRIARINLIIKWFDKYLKQ